MCIAIFAQNNSIYTQEKTGTLQIINKTNKKICVKTFTLNNEALHPTPSNTTTLAKETKKAPGGKLNLPLYAPCTHIMIDKYAYKITRAPQDTANKNQIHNSKKYDIFVLGTTKKGHRLSYDKEILAISTPGRIDWTKPQNAESNISCDWECFYR